MNILSIDFGTSSVKMAILNDKYETLKTTKVGYHYEVTNNDWVTLDPDKVFGGFIEGLKDFKEYINDIEVIAYDVFSPSGCFMDEEGTPLYPIITHLDRRAKEQTKEILKTIGKQSFQNITGVQPFTGGVSITNVLWMKENIPEIFNKTYRFGHLNTYIYYKLTGKWATDPTNASMMGLYETAKLGSWSNEICDTFNIPINMLPPIYDAGTVLGGLRKDIAELTGLKEGIPVVLGSNDAATAQLGAGNSKSGDILITCGSSEMVSILTDKPVINDKFYLRNAVTPGMWQFYATTVGGFAIDWFREEFYSEMDPKHFFKVYFENLMKESINGTTVKFQPYLAGDRQSLRKKRGTFSGITLDTKREDFLKAILIGINQPIKRTIQIASQHIELSNVIKITGGLVTDGYIMLKKSVYKDFDFEFEVVDDCPILGNTYLAINALNNI